MVTRYWPVVDEWVWHAETLYCRKRRERTQDAADSLGVRSQLFQLSKFSKNNSPFVVILRDVWPAEGVLFSTVFFLRYRINHLPFVQPCDMTSRTCVQQTGKERFSRSAGDVHVCEPGQGIMNGYRSEQEEASCTVGQICCLVEDSERCKRPAGNASYSKRIQKTVSQRKLKLSLDVNVRIVNFFVESSRNDFCSIIAFKILMRSNFYNEWIWYGFVSGEAHLHLRASQKYDSKCSQQKEAQRFGWWNRNDGGNRSDAFFVFSFSRSFHWFLFRSGVSRF